MSFGYIGQVYKAGMYKLKLFGSFWDFLGANASPHSATSGFQHCREEAEDSRGHSGRGKWDEGMSWIKERWQKKTFLAMKVRVNTDKYVVKYVKGGLMRYQRYEVKGPKKRHANIWWPCRTTWGVHIQIGQKHLEHRRFKSRGSIGSHQSEGLCVQIHLCRLQRSTTFSNRPCWSRVQPVVSQASRSLFHCFGATCVCRQESESEVKIKIIVCQLQIANSHLQNWRWKINESDSARWRKTMKNINGNMPN